MYLYIILSLVLFISFALFILHFRNFLKTVDKYEILEQYYANVLTSYRNPEFEYNPYLLLDYPKELNKLRDSSLFSRFSFSNKTLDLEQNNFYSHNNDTLWIIGQKNLEIDLYIHYQNKYFEKNSNKLNGFSLKGYNLKEESKESSDLGFITIRIPENAILQVPRKWFFYSNSNFKVFTTKSPISSIYNLFF